ncbi:MAG: hypothetical protein M0T86_07070 [Betaproteobacteria bacterium]|nr:hypothetical protein [Betaproteobacteria bacterium]
MTEPVPPTDVVHLLARSGGREIVYQEIRAQEAAARGFLRWPLLREIHAAGSVERQQ